MPPLRVKCLRHIRFSNTLKWRPCANFVCNFEPSWSDRILNVARRRTKHGLIGLCFKSVLECCRTLNTRRWRFVWYQYLTVIIIVLVVCVTSSFCCGESMFSVLLRAASGLVARCCNSACFFHLPTLEYCHEHGLTLFFVSLHQAKVALGVGKFPVAAAGRCCARLCLSWPMPPLVDWLCRSSPGALLVLQTGCVVPAQTPSWSCRLAVSF